jgi:hypothetical protein
MFFTGFTTSTKFSQIKVTSMLLNSNVSDASDSSNAALVGCNRKYLSGFLIGTKNNLKRICVRIYLKVSLNVIP